jgi:hypothetical protein
MTAIRRSNALGQRIENRAHDLHNASRSRFALAFEDGGRARHIGLVSTAVGGKASEK